MEDFEDFEDLNSSALDRTTQVLNHDNEWESAYFDSLSRDEFKSRFRMNKDTFNRIIEMVII